MISTDDLPGILALLVGSPLNHTGMLMRERP